jgi:hypothetical protein
MHQKLRLEIFVRRAAANIFCEKVGGLWLREKPECICVDKTGLAYTRA